jgi:hypothetical protein
LRRSSSCSSIWALGFTALAIDRRALLVSALAYVLYALNSLFQNYGAVELSFALTALVIGSALLLLSAFWHTARRAVVNTLPAAFSRAFRWWNGWRSAPNQLHKPAFHRCENGAQFMPRFSTAPFSPISAHMPCRFRKAGAFLF